MNRLELKQIIKQVIEESKTENKLDSSVIISHTAYNMFKNKNKELDFVATKSGIDIIDSFSKKIANYNMKTLELKYDSGYKVFDYLPVLLFKTVFDSLSLKDIENLSDENKDKLKYSLLEIQKIMETN